jgi:hypothetical protein
MFSGWIGCSTANCDLGTRVSRSLRAGRRHGLVGFSLAISVPTSTSDDNMAMDICRQGYLYCEPTCLRGPRYQNPTACRSRAQTSSAIPMSQHRPHQVESLMSLKLDQCDYPVASLPKAVCVMPHTITHIELAQRQMGSPLSAPPLFYLGTLYPPEAARLEVGFLQCDYLLFCGPGARHLGL